jgi:predicted nucleic acid-binding protein
MIDLESFSGGRVYLDANVFIYAVEGFKKYAELCSVILQSVQDMKIRTVTSELTLAEVLVKPLKQEKAGVAAIYEDLIQSQYNLEVVPISRDILLSAAKHRAATGCRLPDAIHIATAKAKSAAFLFTADKSIKAPQPLRVVTLDELLEG